MKRGVDYIGVGIGAIIINNEGKLLLTKRGLKAQNEIGKWTFPGGTLEFGESFEQCIKREIKEELCVNIEVVKQIAPFNHLIPLEKQHWVALGFICKISHGIPEIQEPEKHETFGWFSLKEAKKLDLNSAALSRIEQLQRDYPHGLPNFF